MPVTVASVDPPAEKGNYEEVHCGSAPFESHAQSYSSWRRAEGGRVVTYPWGLPPRYRRNHHQMRGDLPSVYHCTPALRRRRKHLAHRLTFLCCYPRERTRLGADNREDNHQSLGPASSSLAAGQIPSAPALGTSSAFLVFSGEEQDPSRRWRLYDHASWDALCQEEHPGSQSNKTQPQGR